MKERTRRPLYPDFQFPCKLERLTSSECKEGKHSPSRYHGDIRQCKKNRTWNPFTFHKLLTEGGFWRPPKNKATTPRFTFTPLCFTWSLLLLTRAFPFGCEGRGEFFRWKTTSPALGDQANRSPVDQTVWKQCLDVECTDYLVGHATDTADIDIPLSTHSRVNDARDASIPTGTYKAACAPRYN
ncbi:hypothetical protein F5Y17DRAFT_375784 [Xylariaceae sp. FL0594]|nr:hypothetical protein F5Y17DRAFT_375784 [Xylariaceae sp. FL0594]